MGNDKLKTSHGRGSKSNKNKNEVKSNNFGSILVVFIVVGSIGTVPTLGRMHEDILLMIIEDLAYGLPKVACAEVVVVVDPVARVAIVTELTVEELLETLTLSLALAMPLAPGGALLTVVGNRSSRRTIENSWK